MSEPENFLTRWSRRKTAAVEEKSEPPVAAVDETAAGDEQKSAAPPPAAPSQTVPAAIDPATLPSIDSIVAGTDISAFLRAGVPAELTRAALRRAWATDPAIRDFVGLSENSWDFTAPDGVPGFGPLSAEDAGRLMAQFLSTAKDIAGKAKEAVERISAFEPPVEPVQTASSPNETGPSPSPISPRSENQMTENSPQISPPQIPEVGAGELDSLQRNKEFIATQKTLPENIADSRPARRGHGGALPE